MTRVVRRPVAIWLLLGMTVALLATGCGTSSIDMGSDASAPSRTEMPPRIGQSQVYRVPSASMEPTLPIGTRVLVRDGPPTVGAIMVFHPPEGAEQGQCGPQPPRSQTRRGRLRCTYY